VHENGLEEMQNEAIVMKALHDLRDASLGETKRNVLSAIPLMSQ